MSTVRDFTSPPFLLFAGMLVSCLYENSTLPLGFQPKLYQSLQELVELEPSHCFIRVCMSTGEVHRSAHQGKWVQIASAQTPASILGAVLCQDGYATTTTLIDYLRARSAGKPIQLTRQPGAVNLKG